MHRFIIAVLAVLALASCDRFPDNGIQIGGMLPLEADCTIDTGTELRRSRGLWDIGPNSPAVLRGRPYTVTPLLQGFFISRALEFQAETNNFQVTNLEIVLQTPDNVDLVLPSPLINPFSVTASAVLPAGDEIALGTTRSIGIPGSYAAAVDQGAAAFGQVVIAMEAVGTTVGGFTNFSDTFFYPVTLCSGCRDLCPPSRDPDIPLTDVEIALLDASCDPGQDIYFYCSNPPNPPPPEDL